MFRWFAFSLASKVRLPKNNVHLVGSRLSWSRNCAVNDSKFVSPCTKYKLVLAESMCNEASKVMTAGVNIKDVRKGIQMAIKAVLRNLSCSARPITTSEEIAQVATTYANGDKEIGMLIAKALEEVRNQEGHIYISVGKNSRTELNYFYGLYLEAGYLSSCFVTNKAKKICVLNDPKIFIYENILSNFDVLVEVLRLAAQHPILIVAKDFDDHVLDSLIMRKLITGNKVCAVKAPNLDPGDTWNDILDLLVSVTRGKVFTEANCLDFRYSSIEDSMPTLKSMLGHCYKVIVEENDIVIIAEHYSMEDIERMRSIEEAEFGSKSPRIAGEDCLESDEVYEGDWLFAVLKVGGASKADVAKKKNIVTQALLAAKAAKKEGIVPGGGTAFLNASKELDKLQITNYGQNIGVQIIRDALKMPMFKIAASAGVKGSVVVGKLLEQDDPNLGYDADKGEYIDTIKHGVVDPLEVIRTTFVGATRMFLKKLRKRELHDCESELDNEDVDKKDTKEEDDVVGQIQRKAI